MTSPPTGPRTVVTSCSCGCADSDAAELCYGQVQVMRPTAPRDTRLTFAASAPCTRRAATGLHSPRAQGAAATSSRSRAAGADLRAVTHFCDDPVSRLYATAPSWQPIPPG